MREPMASVDLTLLRLENPTNLMVVTGVLVLGSPIGLERLKATLEARLLRFDRFRQRVVNLGREQDTSYWQDDPNLDLDYHVQRIALPLPGDEAALQALVSRMISIPLDPDKPLWQFHLVEPYGQGCAVLCRVHHSVGDGQALVQVLLSLTDSGADAPSSVAPEGTQVAPSRDGPAEPRPALARLGFARGAGRKLVRRGLRLATHPSRVVKLAETGGKAARALGRLALTMPEPNTALSGKLGVAKKATWSAAIPLDSVKFIGRRLGGTVNDVLLSAVAGALRHYLLSRGEAVDGVELHAAIPVSMRSPETGGALGNQVGAVLLRLPVFLADPAERLKVTRERMDRRKNSLEAPIIYAGLKVLGTLPFGLETSLVDHYSSRLTAVMTNVPGPRERLWLAGAPVDVFMFWVPKTGGVGLGVSLLSYAGEVRVGIISDAGLVPDPEAIVTGFEAEFGALLAQAEAVAEPVSFRASLSMLDDALATLQDLLDGRSEAPGRIAEDVVDRCQALTRAGVPCRNRPLPGARTCHIHQAAQDEQ